jgi:hypothetical protein
MIYIDYTSAPFFYGILVTRAVQFGRFLRVYTVFGAGLFACSTSTLKTGIFLGIGALLGFAFAAGIPVDATKQNFDLLYYIGITKYTKFLFLGAEFVSVLNFLLAGILKSLREYYFIAVTFLIAIAGADLIILFPGNIYILGLGFVLLIIGTILFSNRIHKLYLWSYT